MDSHTGSDAGGSVVFDGAANQENCSLLDGSSPSINCCADESEMRNKLRFFFMNPCEKFRVRGRKPWKLGVQILKIIMVTLQLMLFGLSNQLVVTFQEENIDSFRHLFLKDYATWNDETFSVYTQKDLYDYMAYTLNQYVQLPCMSLAKYGYLSDNDGAVAPLYVCKSFYKGVTENPSNESFNINPVIKRACVDVFPLIPLNGTSIDETKNVLVVLFHKVNLTLDLYRLINVEISFRLKTINLQTVRNNEMPDCYLFSISVTFDNKAHSGKVKIGLDSDAEMRECRIRSVDDSTLVQTSTQYMMVFDGFVMTLCAVSFLLCTRSLIRSLKLSQEFHKFYTLHYDHPVSWAGRLEFVNGWYILIIISDIFTIIGSIVKIGIESKMTASYDICSIFLGTSTLLVWVGVIKYMSYFKTYNILVLTMRAALPSVMRFCCCAGMIYLGYCFCGWVVLGPYHPKFRTLVMASECLFSLINGDDMFATFTEIKGKVYLVWIFSQVYLYTFISLFIYMILSVFIALITETYECIKHYQQTGGIGCTEVHTFLAAGGPCAMAPGPDTGETACSLLSCCFRQNPSD
uniref:mucolipin-3-like isoform X2 n=1 Tax=Myxine glutinosa TaxID=7769 RepID=UPI00358E90D9